MFEAPDYLKPKILLTSGQLTDFKIWKKFHKQVLYEKHDAVIRFALSPFVRKFKNFCLAQKKTEPKIQSVKAAVVVVVLVVVRIAVVVLEVVVTSGVGH